MTDFVTSRARSARLAPPAELRLPFPHFPLIVLETLNPLNASLLIVISAPSGGGKTTLCQGLLESDPKVVRAVTCTTRSPRPGEVSGVDYYFLKPAEFLTQVETGHFLEHALVHENSYG